MTEPKPNCTAGVLQIDDGDWFIFVHEDGSDKIQIYKPGYKTKDLAEAQFAEWCKANGLATDLPRTAINNDQFKAMVERKGKALN